MAKKNSPWLYKSTGGPNQLVASRFLGVSYLEFASRPSRGTMDSLKPWTSSFGTLENAKKASAKNQDGNSPFFFLGEGSGLMASSPLDLHIHTQIEVLKSDLQNPGRIEHWTKHSRNQEALASSSVRSLERSFEKRNYYITSFYIDGWIGCVYEKG